MKLIIVHYHLRPGGVRRVIELATPHLVRECRERITEVVLASGESGDEAWENLFRARLSPTPVHFVEEPVLRYVSEQRASPGLIAKRVDRAVERLLCAEKSEAIRLRRDL